jgi:transforming growth factor-beta-induced protein
MKIRNLRGLVAAAVLAVTTVSAFAQDIVHTAEKAGAFKTLLAAAKAAGLVNVLKSDGPFTVFAPTDEAFAKLGTTVNELLKPENKHKLQAILKYHVLPTEVLAARVVKLKDGSMVKTVQGEKITIRNRNGVKVNNANVIKTDVLADNGVIHVIDSVLLPPSFTKQDEHAQTSTCGGGK